MNFATFTGHIPTAQQIPSKCNYQTGPAVTGHEVQRTYQPIQFAVPNTDTKFRHDGIVVASNAIPSTIHTVNTGIKYQTISSTAAVNVSNVTYGQTGYITSDHLKDHRIAVVDKREYREELHHDLMATMMQQHQVTSATPLQQGQQLVVVLHEPKDAAAIARAIKQEARPAATAPAEFISIGDVGESAAWQSLGGGVADYLSALPLPLHHLLKYSAPTDKREEQAIVATVPTVMPNMTTNSVGGVVVQTATLVNQTVTTTPAISVPKKKKKKKPPKEKKPRLKPGEIRLTTALDGSTLYCCPECHMAYPERGLLEQHLVGHTMERRFICDICNAALKRKDHLTRHKQSHNPERPHVCTVCLKAFKRKEQLTLHFVIHSGEKRHVCNECGKGFYRKDHLRKHTRSHIARRVKAEMSQQGNAGGTLSLAVPAPVPS